MIKDKSEYINSINLKAHTDFPYLVLNVVNERAIPQNPGFRVMHWHEDLQFIYVLDGTVTVRTLEEMKTLHAGEGIFINKNVVHLVEKIESCNYKSFLFPDYFLFFYLGSPASNLTENITNSSHISLISLRQEKDWNRDILEYLKELVLLENDKTVFYCYEVLVTLSKLWLVLLKNVNIPLNGADNAVSRRMRKFLHYIETNYTEEISLEELSNSANVSKSECLRCFKESLQTTPYRYLMDFRLSKAAKMLTETDWPISEVASRTGFNGQSYFGKCFKEKMGCTPRDYRADGCVPKFRE